MRSDPKAFSVLTLMFLGGVGAGDCAPMVYGGFQARGQIGAADAGLCATATAMPDPTHICNLHHSSWQRWIIYPLSEARYQNCILMDASQIHFCWAMTGIPSSTYFFIKSFIYISEDWWILILYIGLNTILFCCSYCSSFRHWKLLQVAPVPLRHVHVIVCIYVFFL